MTRTGIAAGLLAGLCQTALAGEISSAYTEIDVEKGCSIFAASEEEGPFANLVCNGWQGYPVLIFSGDLRESVFYGFPPDTDLPWESFSAFNSSGGRVEWRLEKDGQRSVPFATIHRWSVNADPENPERRIEVLVVEKVGQVDKREGCAVELVLATGNPQANETARRIADERARDFDCGTDKPAAVGEGVPEFTSSAN